MSSAWNSWYWLVSCDFRDVVSWSPIYRIDMSRLGGPYNIVEGCLEAKLPTIWTEGKAEVRREEKRREEQSRAEQRREEKKRERIRRKNQKKESEERIRRKNQKKEDAEERRCRRKKMQMCEKVAKSRNIAFLQWFVALEGRKVGSLKRRVRSRLGRWEINNCTPLWREAHFEVKMCKIKYTRFGTLLEVEMSKKCTPLRREAHFEVNMVQSTPGFGPRLEVEISKKCTPLWREAHFEVKMCKIHQVRNTFGSWDVEKCTPL